MPEYKKAVSKIDFMDEKISSLHFSIRAFSIIGSQHTVKKKYNVIPKEDLYAIFFFYTSCFLPYKFYISAGCCRYDTSFKKPHSKYQPVLKFIGPCIILIVE